MKFALPILAADGREFADARALDALLSGETSGHYLLGNHRKWHGGIHISDASAPWCRDKHPVRAMADGKVVAFRMLDHYLSSEFQGEALRYSNCFCLIEHHYCETNPETQAKNEFTFYSLYMHLKPWQPEQDGERLVLKKRWNVRNSVPHHQPDAEQQKADAKLPATPLPAGTELEPVAQCEPVWGTVSGKDYRFIKVSITSALSPEVQTAGAQAGVLLTQGSQVWIAEDDTALERIKPSQPLWLFDEIDAELTCDLEGHADPQFNGPTGKLLAGGYNTSLPSGTQVQYDAHRLEFHWLDGKARKMARCHYRTPAQGSQPERTGVAWVCVEESNIHIRHQRPTHLNQLYVLPSPVAISAGETVGFLGLMENPASSLGGKQGKYQVHLELFTQDPRLDDVLANQANTAGGTRYARVPAGLTLYQKRDNQWVATTAQSQAALLTAPRVEQSGDKCWLCVKEGAYVAKEQAEMLSQHDWLKLGFKKVDGSGSDGYLDPQQAPAFFEELVHCLDTNQDGHLSSEEITAALCHIEPILHSPQSRTRLQKLIVRHPSEWYDKSAGASHQWLDKLKAQVAKPEFDQLVAHEKQRIDQLEWMHSATSLKLSRDIWHFWPLVFHSIIRNKFILKYTYYSHTLTDALNKQMSVDKKYGPKIGNNEIASRDEVLQQMKPNDDVTHDEIYQFLDLSKPSDISLSELNKFLSGQGVLEGMGDTFISAAQRHNINEVYLVAHASLETGKGTSSFARGKLYNGTIIHNMYGINVRDDKPSLGISFAYEQGWTSIEAAIDGGAKWISENFINNRRHKQNTLYKMRWNPSNPGQHQYASDILWAKHQIQGIKRKFDLFPDALIHLDIPVYKE